MWKLPFPLDSNKALAIIRQSYFRQVRIHQWDFSNEFFKAEKLLELKHFCSAQLSSAVKYKIQSYLRRSKVSNSKF